MRRSSFVLALAFVAPALALDKAPETPKKPVTDTYHGVAVTEDYRWLEANDDPEVKRWSDAQNARTRAYLDAVPHMSEIRARIDTLIRSGSVSYGVIGKRGGKLVAMKFDPAQQQPTLVTLASADDVKSERTIVDPNVLDKSGAIAIDWAIPSLDGAKIGVSLSRGGSEKGELHVYDVAAAKDTGEIVPHVQEGTAGGSMAFAPDGSGLWYTRYPRAGERPDADSSFYQQVFFHRFGAKDADDRYELGKDFPKIAEVQLALKHDGKWLLAEVKNGDGGEVEYFVRPTSAKGKWTQVSTFADKAVIATFGEDDALYLVSRLGAPMGKVLRLPLATPRIEKAALIVAESDGAIRDLVATKSRLYIEDTVGGPARVRMVDLHGKALGDLPLLSVSAAYGIVPLDGDDVLVDNGSWIEPPAWYRYDAASGKSTKTALAETSIAKYDDAEVVRVLVASKDGTKVPINIIKRKDTKLDGTNPTLLTAYGGYGVTLSPGFSTTRRLWLDQGGVVVVANIRGGGEFGDAWHLAGNLLNKQNDYDDFYAAARWLIDNKYTSPAKLAIMGGSNGGLLMGAALTQHPETYRAVVSEVGIYDMLRVELTRNGAFNVTEFGTVKDEAQFKAMYAYSPLHHVVDGVNYPSILLTTGANDPRVDPWHSRKFLARLQAANASANPILLRTSDKAGHGIGSSLDEIIAERADTYAFMLHELGVDYRAP